MEKYLEDVDDLLQTIYGICICDVSEALVQSCFESGESPEQCVQQIGEKDDLIALVEV